MALFFPPCSFFLPFPLNLKRAIIPHSFCTSSSLLLQCSAAPTSFLLWSPHYPFEKANLTLPSTSIPASSFSGTKITDFEAAFDELDAEEEDLAASPWEGAVVYRRDSSVTHVEYCTTLERLGLARLSSGLSRSRASETGIRFPTLRATESGLREETPVLVSVDVTRRKRRLKLDGILRTVLTLGCNRCGEPAAETVFSNFTLLLTENPLHEDQGEVDMGVLHGADRVKSSSAISSDEIEDDEDLIDEDDKLYFPAEAKEIDLSKHIRDLVHVEITINSVCSPNCRGLCLKCGTNLNHSSSCSCSQEDADPGTKYGPLGHLRKQMQTEL